MPPVSMVYMAGFVVSAPADFSENLLAVEKKAIRCKAINRGITVLIKIYRKRSMGWQISLGKPLQ